jgi:hypothetical protein
MLHEVEMELARECEEKKGHVCPLQDEVLVRNLPLAPSSNVV